MGDSPELYGFHTVRDRPVARPRHLLQQVLELIPRRTRIVQLLPCASPSPVCQEDGDADARGVACSLPARRAPYERLGALAHVGEVLDDGARDGDDLIE